MIYEDDRTEEQKKTHTWLVIGTDSFLSGWGKAQGMASYAVWACKPDDSALVRDWVESRSDMKRVRETVEPYRPKGNVHCHVYVVNKDHPSVRRSYQLREESEETALRS